MNSSQRFGPSSTKNVTIQEKKNVAYFQRNVFMDDNNVIMGTEEEKDDVSRIFSLSNNEPGLSRPDHGVTSVADRSVLSQNFVNGTEESEESIIGIERKPTEKPLAYVEFKEAVKRKAEESTAPTHKDFMWEVSERKSLSL